MGHRQDLILLFQTDNQKPHSGYPWMMLLIRQSEEISREASTGQPERD